MRILITYGDGSVESVPVTLEGGLVSSGGSWVPGHSVAEPARCPVGSDYFCAALDEGGLVSGSMEATEDEGYPPEPAFSWALEGTDEEECLSKMRRWIGVLGADFDCSREGADYLSGGLLRVLDEGAARAYDRDRECWDHFLDDPGSHAGCLLSEAGFMQPASPSPLMRPGGTVPGRTSGGDGKGSGMPPHDVEVRFRSRHRPSLR